MGILIVLVGALFLAYANGGNDNFKGVASLHGSGTATFRQALIYGTVATAAVSVAAILLSKGLIAAFSGKGLAPISLASSHTFVLSVVIAATLTVLIATRLSLPVSTTRAILGALIGVGLAGSPGGINMSTLGHSFVMPLLISPILAIAGTFVAYPSIRFAKCMARIPASADALKPDVPQPRISGGVETSAIATLPVSVESRPAHSEVIDKFHYLSSGVVSFARGLNDTPKIAALCLAGTSLSLRSAVLLVAVGIAIGGLLNARRVAETMSHRISDMSPIQGFSANLVTGLLVTIASGAGLPVSTTHVSCGSLFGIGVVSRTAHWRVIGTIITAWITTLPIAAIIGAVAYALVRHS